MLNFDVNTAEIIGCIVLLLAIILIALWMIFRKRSTPEEIEQQRRDQLVKFGRIVDGTLSDIYEVECSDGRTHTMLLYVYRISGVDYECSQDVTNLPSVINAASFRVSFPTSVRYQPGNPQNSIIAAESWSGLHLTTSDLETSTPISVESPAILRHSYPGSEHRG